MHSLLVALFSLNVVDVRTLNHVVLIISLYIWTLLRVLFCTGISREECTDNEQKNAYSVKHHNFNNLVKGI